MAALSAGLLAGANGAGLRLALRGYFATLGAEAEQAQAQAAGADAGRKLFRGNRQNGEK
jgi:hypothetical protein